MPRWYTETCKEEWLRSPGAIELHVVHSTLCPTSVLAGRDSKASYLGVIISAFSPRSNALHSWANGPDEARTRIGF